MPDTSQRSNLLNLTLKILAAFLLVAILAGMSIGFHTVDRASAQAGQHRIFLPITASSYRNSSPILLGIYPPDYMGTQGAIDSNIKDLDRWAGKGVTIAASFIDFEDPNPNYNIPVPMELLWDNGYTPFVNLMTRHSASDLAQGREDGDIRAIASAFAHWMATARQNQEQRMVFLAPMPEANITNGNDYGGDPSAFKSAYWRIQDIFADEFAKRNVPFGSIQWVFAPNAVDEPGRPTFEAYYPGHDATDIVGFSSYNLGYCIHWEYDRWQLGPELFLPYVQRMNTLAPGKPIFISQTASSAEYPRAGSFDHAQKSQWFIDAYGYLAGLNGVRAILYFNIDAGGCDFAFFRSGSLYYEGYRQVISSAAFEYLRPNQMIGAFVQAQ